MAGREDSLTPYSDLALESPDLGQLEKEAVGVESEEEQHGLALITRIKILNQIAASRMQKPPGTYITIETATLREQSREEQLKISYLLGLELERMIRALVGVREPHFFVVGLGNWRATPDALGPETVGQLMVTRHLYQETPPELREGLSSVSALAPGVLGITGIETGEIIRGIVDHIRPHLVLAIDALAARSTERLSSSIQLCDTGVAPGSGLGTRRVSITQQRMGVPVIALGVPTVIHATTIVAESIKRVMNQDQQYSALEEKNAASDILSPFIGQLVVTPKGIDQLIENLSRVLAGGINMALHPDINQDNLADYM